METGQRQDTQESADSIAGQTRNSPAADGRSQEQGSSSSKESSPMLCVDIIIDMGAGMIALVKRKFAPLGWAIPGGFVESHESAEEAALRETYEETGLDVELVRQFHVYSNPKRDPRGPSASVVFIARGWGTPKAGDDASDVQLFHEMNLPPDLAFDHAQILKDYYRERY